jgi:hypothetical protein
MMMPRWSVGANALHAALNSLGGRGTMEPQRGVHELTTMAECPHSTWCSEVS